MPFEYISVEDAIARDGLRMVVVGDIPSPWGEAAKGILHVKGIEWSAVRLVYDSDELKRWAGQRSGPVAVYNGEPPRSGWSEILTLAERLAPQPALVPDDAEQRIAVFGIAQELCGEGGLGWSRRLDLIDARFAGRGGFAEPVAKYLARKYGYRPGVGDDARRRVRSGLAMLVARLRAQRAAGSGYIVGDGLTAADIYCATFAGMFQPLAENVCAMEKHMRAAFATLDDETKAVLDPVLFEHRDMMYERHLELPMSL
ncbi:glutathione S-transferase C-terminal domain-containing protein [Mesorhizobium sp. Z1-4]|uniref:glutathione binding-like protein n=1 Tax=Mesorhizobium sp. Z1-4 TaxID=2448478 RepID=UPI000FDC94F0|nr:glutathione S-transferase C-terminal domain-containing protein [Mesorhizobium sp. Z1-4]